MGIRDSREQFKNPRWAIGAASETPDADAVEPPSQQKDHGWQPGTDVPVTEWWNWMWLQVYLFLAYIESAWANRWGINHLTRDQAGTTAGQVTAGTGLSVNVAAATVWIEGQQFEVPAETNLALDTADPTDPRIDLIVADVTSNIPSFQVLTGTPDSSPSPPAAASNQVAMAQVSVAAGASAPGAIADRRRFGALALGRLAIDEDLDFGEDGSVLKARANAGFSPTLTLFDDVGGLPIVQVKNGLGDAELTWLVGSGPLLLDMAGNLSATVSGDVTIDAGGDVVISGDSLTIPPPVYDSPINGYYEMSAEDFEIRVNANDPEQLAYNDTVLPGKWEATGGGDSDANILFAPVHVPVGATITAVRGWGNKADDAEAGIRMQLYAVTKTTGSATEVSDANNFDTGTGNFVLSETASKTVVSGETLVLRVGLRSAGGTIEFWAAEVEYTFTAP